MTRQNTVAGRSIEEQFEQFESSSLVLILMQVKMFCCCIFHFICDLQGYVLKKKIELCVKKVRRMKGP